LLGEIDGDKLGDKLALGLTLGDGEIDEERLGDNDSLGETDGENEPAAV
jgi:hypothetical protein